MYITERDSEEERALKGFPGPVDYICISYGQLPKTFLFLRVRAAKIVDRPRRAGGRPGTVVLSARKV